MSFNDELYYKIQKALESTNCKWIKNNQEDWKSGQSETITYFTDKESEMLAMDVLYKNSNYLKCDMAKNLTVSVNKGYCFNIKITKGEKDKEKYLAIDLYSVTSKVEIKLNDKKIPYICASDDRIIHSYIFWDNKQGLTKGNHSKFRPCSLKDLRYLPQEIIEAILTIYSGKSNLYKDLIRENVFPPIPLNNLCEFYNKKQYLEYVFKMHLPKSVNKRPLVDSYSACCAAKYVLSEQIRYIFEPQHSCNFNLHMSTRERKNIAQMFIQDIIKKRRPSLSGGDVYEYTSKSIEMKKPIDILAGKRKMDRLYNEATLKSIKKSLRSKKIEIPESPMKYLKLPKNYILLTTKESVPFPKERRNISEGRCVGYAVNIEDEFIYIFISVKKTKSKNKPTEFTFNSNIDPYTSKGRRIKNRIKDAIKAATPKALETYSKSQQSIIEKASE